MCRNVMMVVLHHSWQSLQVGRERTAHAEDDSKDGQNATHDDAASYGMLVYMFECKLMNAI